MAKRADAVHSSDVPLYSTGDMTSALGISRATLLYYESHGAVAPNKDEKTGYRSYTNDDVQRLMCGVMLKNLGMRTGDLTDYLSDDPFTAERFAVYNESVRHKISYCQAQLECLERLQRMHDATGTLWVEEIEPFYICYDASELGYEDYPDTGALDLLLRNMPIGSVGAQFDGDLFDIGLRPRWGRTVAVRHADLIPGLPHKASMSWVDACACARRSSSARYWSPTTTRPRCAGRCATISKATGCESPAVRSAHTPSPRGRGCATCSAGRSTVWRAAGRCAGPRF